MWTAVSAHCATTIAPLRTKHVSFAIDPVELSRALIRCPSVTPADAGALDVLELALQQLGFTCERMLFEEAGTAPVDNLYAQLGK